MYCLKCGKEIREGCVFCDHCLQTMEKYPVKSDAPIHLPKRRVEEIVKKQSHRRRPLPPEEQILHLKKLLRRMTVCAVILLLVLCLATALLIKEHWLDSPVQQPMGRNYTITAEQPE